MHACAGGARHTSGRAYPPRHRTHATHSAQRLCVRAATEWECTCLLLLQEIHIAEIDGEVPEVSRKFFPGMAVGFTDPRVKVHICDGIK